MSFRISLGSFPTTITLDGLSCLTISENPSQNSFVDSLFCILPTVLQAIRDSCGNPSKHQSQQYSGKTFTLGIILTPLRAM